MNENDASREGERIRAEATRWFVLLHESPADPEPRAAFEVWRAADPRHAASYERLQRLWGAAGHLDSIELPKSRPDRRALVQGGFAALGLVGLVGTGRLVLGPHPFADQATSAGERRTVALPDGSFAELSSATALSVRFDERLRAIELLAGEAFFRVAADPGRLFQVKAAAGHTTTADASFGVALRDGRARVTAPEDAVLVQAADSRVRLGAGRSLTYDRSSVGNIQIADADRLAWRSGRLAFVDQPLGEVIGEVNRWTRGRVVVIDDALARRRVTLMLRTDDADHAMDRIGEVIPVRVTRLTDLLTLVDAA